MRQIIPSFANGFYSPAVATGEALYPNLWQGCIGAWNPAIGPTGSTLFDWSGHKNHGTFQNDLDPSDWTIDKYGPTISYFGFNERVDTTLAGSFIGTGPFALSIWAKSSGTQKDAFPVLIAAGDTGTGEWMLRHYQTNLSWYANSGVFTFTATAHNIDSDISWHHYVLHRKADGNSELYVDGAFLADSASGSGQDVNTSKVVQFGNGDASTSRYFFGKIGEARVFDRSLAVGEIALLASDPHAPYRVKRRRRAVIAAAAAGGFTAAFAGRSNVLIQPHVTA